MDTKEKKDKDGMTARDYAYLVAAVNDHTYPKFESFEAESEYYRQLGEQLYLENPEQFEKIVRENS